VLKIHKFILKISPHFEYFLSGVCAAAPAALIAAADPELCESASCTHSGEKNAWQEWRACECERERAARVKYSAAKSDIGLRASERDVLFMSQRGTMMILLLH
jgi:hypothetical protein